MKTKGLFKAVTIAVLMAVSFASCGGNGSNSRAEQDAREANGNIDGTESPADNENSGQAPDVGPGAGPATDTVNSSGGANRGIH